MRSSNPLERECGVYARYLIGMPASAYVVEKYLDFHEKSDVMRALSSDRFDRFLVGASARGTLGARLADSYASRFAKGSNVRKKLALTLALLECGPPGAETLDQVRSNGFLGAAGRLGWGALVYALTLMAAAVAFTPVRLGFALVSPRSEEH